MAKIGLMEIKIALNDARFRETLPETLKDELIKYLHCTSCPTNVNFLRKVLKNCKKQLLEYFPGNDLDEAEEIKKLEKNQWTVVNCNISELEDILRHQFPSGRKQIAITRYGDDVTLVVNELDVVY